MVFVMALYTFPYVFTFVANSLDMIPSELEEASAIFGASPWRTAMNVTLPLVMPALLAGFIIAFLQSMTLFGVPAILALPAGVDTGHHQDLEPLPVPPQPGLAAAASLPLLLVTVALLRTQAGDHGPPRLLDHRRQEHGHRTIRLRAWKVPALAAFAFVLACSVVLPYGVLVRTAFLKNWSAPIAGNFSFEHWHFVFLEFSQTKTAFANTFTLGATAATAGTILAVTIAYLSLRKLVWGHRYLAFLATAPVAIPGIVLAVGLFLAYTQPPLVLYGTLVIIFLAYVTKELPVGYQQVASRSRPCTPSSRRRAASSAPPGCARSWTSPRPHPQRRDRDLDPHLHRLDPRALGDHPALHREDQDHLGHRCSTCARATTGARSRSVDHHARDHLRDGRGRQPLHRPEAA
jgi:iron(III) transport system permease protein